jgi:hypothetical protein
MKGKIIEAKYGKIKKKKASTHMVEVAQILGGN